PCFYRYLCPAHTLTRPAPIYEDGQRHIHTWSDREQLQSELGGVPRDKRYGVAGKGADTGRQPCRSTNSTRRRPREWSMTRARRSRGRCSAASCARPQSPETSMTSLR
ncbi:unnamed protein product, partial [Ectocarpus sp. 8 AP-2014]